MVNQEVILRLFKNKLTIINVGIEALVEHLDRFDTEVIQVDWSPPAGGNLEVLNKLRKLMKY